MGCVVASAWVVTVSLFHCFTVPNSTELHPPPPPTPRFERGLAQLAPLADPGLLTVQAGPYDSPAAVLFQRGTVMLADGNP
jgi:hypothetical protein